MEFSDIDAQVIGEGVRLPGPFGERPLVYADYTASGRAFRPIEEFIQHRVLPYYGNTHSDSSLSGRQSGALREQARETIRKAVNAGDEHAIIFCGSGATAAINRLVDILNLRLPRELDTRYQLLEQIPLEQRPVVLIGPYEHHSNELPWRESIARLEVVPLDAEGGLDLRALESLLHKYAGCEHLYGSFSAASNVTGIKTDTQAVSALMHRFGGRIFWDFAAAAPYVAIDVSAMDAVFISPHKFLGGPGTPGLLIARRDLVVNRVPSQPGGGTVSFVAPNFHHYLRDIEQREEGGTPAIVGAVRAGLAFRLQQQVGTERIKAQEQKLVQQALERWSGNPDIKILGNPAAPRLSIISFQLLHAGRQLHYAYAVALLNDLFGIQARGGCSCAGPYGHSLLGIDTDISAQLDQQVSGGNTILRPGWVRVNFNYFIAPETFEYILRAVELVAEHGWRLLGDYQYEAAAGTWIHRDSQTDLPVALAEFNGSADLQAPTVDSRALAEYLAEAQALFAACATVPHECGVVLDEQAEQLRWFYLPRDGVAGAADAGGFAYSG